MNPAVIERKKTFNQTMNDVDVSQQTVIFPFVCKGFLTGKGRLCVMAISSLPRRVGRGEGKENLAHPTVPRVSEMVTKYFGLSVPSPPSLSSPRTAVART